MSKVVRCRYVGFDCDGIVQAENEEEVLDHVAQHAKSAHGVREGTQDVVAKVKSVMYDEPAKA